MDHGGAIRARMALTALAHWRKTKYSPVLRPAQSELEGTFCVRVPGSAADCLVAEPVRCGDHEGRFTWARWVLKNSVSFATAGSTYCSLS